MKFREATDQLFSQIEHGELAERLHVSIASIRQARLKPDALAHRAPPKDWEQAVVSLAEQRIEHYRKLAEALRKENNQNTISSKQQIRGRPITECRAI
jgi:hypothetical protein